MLISIIDDRFSLPGKNPMRFRNKSVMLILLILAFPPVVVFSSTEVNPEKHHCDCDPCLFVPMIQINDYFVPEVKGDPTTA